MVLPIGRMVTPVNKMDVMALTKAKQELVTKKLVGFCC
jgi:hypothetical protein